MESLIVSKAEEKKCSKCGEHFPLSQFSIRKASSDGKQSWCKNCLAKAHKLRSKKVKSDVPNPLLAEFTPMELLTELRARGYEGQVTYTEVKVHKIKI